MPAALATHGHRRNDASLRSLKEPAMSRTSFSSASLLFLTLAVVPPLGLLACSSGDVAVGSNEQDLKKQKNGSPTGNGTTCTWGDTPVASPGTSASSSTASSTSSYSVGDTFKSPDGCNDCSCTAQGIVCTLRACATPPPSTGTCTYDGKSYASGATFPSSDGCNSCSCQSNGAVLCTERACAPIAPCLKTGCSGEICSDQNVASSCIWTAKYACYTTAICERDPSGACGFRQTPELTQCLASK
jgi:hypothetical protein